MASTISGTFAPPPYSSFLNSTRSHGKVAVDSSGGAVIATPVRERGSTGLRTYKTSIPLSRLTHYAAPTDCPVCGQRALTRLEYVVGGVTHILAVSFFFFSGVLFWVPYTLKAMKNVHHHCGNPACGVLLATWHRAPAPGSIEVRQFS